MPVGYGASAGSPDTISVQPNTLDTTVSPDVSPGSMLWQQIIDAWSRSTVSTGTSQSFQFYYLVIEAAWLQLLSQLIDYAFAILQKKVG